MGKRGSNLVWFIKKALKDRKYRSTLKLISSQPITFSLHFPRKTQKLNPSDEQFLKDWRTFKKQPYTYSKAKQAIETALKKSDFLQRLDDGTNVVLIYQILEDEQVLAKKKTKGKNKTVAVKEEYISPLSVDSSGYGSGVETGNNYSTLDEELENLKDFLISEEENCEKDYNSSISNEENTLVDMSMINNLNLMDLNADSLKKALCNWDENMKVAYEPKENENDLLPVDPNEIIIDPRNSVPQPNFEVENMNCVDEVKSNPIGNSSDECQNIDFSNPFWFQDAFDGIQVDSPKHSLEDLMELRIPNFEEGMEVDEKPKEVSCYLKEIQHTDEVEIWVFSPNETENVKDGETNPGEMKVVMDKEVAKEMATCSKLSLHLSDALRNV